MRAVGGAGAALLVAAAFMVGCGSDDSGGETSSGKPTDVGRKGVDLQVGDNGLGLGPNGETAVPGDDIELTEAEMAELRNGNFTAAVAWHEAATDFPKSVTRGIRARLEELGIELIAVTDGRFDATKQRNDIESILARKPDVLISIPVDPSTAAPIYRQAQEAGTKLVFLSDIPIGFKHPDDYVGVVSADQVETGKNAADIIGKSLGGEGKIGVLFHDVDFYTTNQRDEAFLAALERDYPDIDVVASAGFDDPAKTEPIVASMLTRNPDLDGVYATWAEPAEGALAAARQDGRDDLKLSTVDLSPTLGVDIARDGITAGVSADYLTDAGATLANVAGAGLLGKEVPPFVLEGSLAVTKDNLLEAWVETTGAEAPAAVKDAAGESG